MMEKNLTFMIEKREKIIGEIKKVDYVGVGYITSGSAVGLGSGFVGDASLGSGLFSTKQIKREGSIFDAKRAYVYLTSKRIVFCNIKGGLLGGEQEIGTPFSVISLKEIKGLSAGTKMVLLSSFPCINIAITGERSGLDNIKIIFPENGWTAENRKEERDKFLDLIKKQLK